MFHTKITFNFITAFIFITATCGCGETYLERYPKECKAAQRFFEEYKTEFEQAGREAGVSAAFLFAIVAPELSQAAYVKNKVETYLVKQAYVSGGSHVDFSIGAFQMKPSFIERMEACVVADDSLKKYFSDCLFEDPDSEQSRTERIDRMNMVEWQMRYLTMFCLLIDKRFDNLSFANEEEKLRFYASAYNCGFHKTEQHIKTTEKKALFPRFASKKFRYTDVALWFYREGG